MPTSSLSETEVQALIKTVTAMVTTVAARVTVIERQLKPKEPPSANLATVAPGAGKLIDHDGNDWAIGLDGVVVVNDLPDTTTRGVVLLAKVDPDSMWQMNGSRRWWSKTLVAGALWAAMPWVGPTEAPAGVVLPDLPPPPPEPPPGTGEEIRYNTASPRTLVLGAGNSIVVNLKSTKRGWLNKAMFGVAAGGLCRTPPWNYRDLITPAQQAAFRDLGLRFVRINGITCISDIFGAGMANSPDWSTLDPLIAGFKTCFPLAKLAFVTANHPSFAYADPAVRAQFASCVAQVAQRFVAGGLRVDYWEVVNEPDHTKTNTPAIIAATEIAVRNALLAVDPTYLVGGPVVSWAQSAWIAASAKAGAQFLSWHYYPQPPGPLAGRLSDDALFANALATGGMAATMQAAAKAVALRDYLTFLTEYNIQTYSNATLGNDPRQQSYKNAIFAAVLLLSKAFGGLSGAAIWRLENDDGTYGVFQTGTWNLNSVGALLKALNLYMGGAIIDAIVRSTTTTKLLVLPAVTDTDFGLAIVNYDSSAAWTGSVVLEGRASAANHTRFDLNAGLPLGLANGAPPAGLTTVTVPPQGVTILAGPR